MGFLKKVIDFVARPSHSRTIGLLVFLVLLTALGLTVYVAQQQQALRQRAAERDAACSPPYINYQSQDDLYAIECPVCAENSTDSFCIDCKKTQPNSYGDLCRKEGFLLITARVDGKDYCYKSTNVGKACGPDSRGTCDDEALCVILPNCKKLTCSPNQTCVGTSYNDGTYCVTKGSPPISAYCGTPNKSPNNDACSSGFCDKSLHCADSNPPTPTPTPTTPASSRSRRCEGTISDVKYQCRDIGCGFNETFYSGAEAPVCPAKQFCCGTALPIAIPTPSPVPTGIANCAIGNLDYRCSVSNPGSSCSRLYLPGQTGNCLPTEGCWFCPQPTSTPIPSASCNNSNSTVDNDCFKRNGVFCAVRSSCKQNPISTTKDCTCQSDTLPTPTLTPAPTGFANVTLAATLNVQDPTVNDANLSADLSLYSLKTNTLVSGAPLSQTFTKTSIPGKKYSANISLTNLPLAKYFIVVRKGPMIAKSLFNVGSATGTIQVPTTTLVFGDINNDNDINALDYQLLRSCYKKTATTNFCLGSDFDKDGLVDQIDFNGLIKGWATWNKEGKEL